MSYKSRKSLLKDKRRIERSHSRRRLHEWLFWPNSCEGLAFHWICSWIWFSDSRHLDFVWCLCNSRQCDHLSRNRNFLSKYPHFHWVCLILNDLHFYQIFFFCLVHWFSNLAELKIYGINAFFLFFSDFIQFKI